MIIYPVSFHRTCNILLLYPQSGICITGSYLAGKSNTGFRTDPFFILPLLSDEVQTTGKGKYADSADGYV